MRMTDASISFLPREKPRMNSNSTLWQDQQTKQLARKRDQTTSVCIIVENLPVPLDRRVWSEARALNEAGYLVSVICPKGKRSHTASYEVLEGIHIYRHHSWEASSPMGYLLE